MTTKSIDILICAHNEASYIPLLFDSLRKQTIGISTFRVIFVDNASTDDTEHVVGRHSTGMNIEYLKEPRLGKNWAINMGYAHASQPYVAHIDADCQADSRWLENILYVIRHEEPDLFGGPYYPYYLTPKPHWYVDRYNSHTHGPNALYLDASKGLSGANMIWKRSIVERLGGFDTSVGITGRSLRRGDEVNLQVRARQLIPNLKVFYSPDIVVYHATRPQYMSVWHQLKRSFADGCHQHHIWGIPYLSIKSASRGLINETTKIMTLLIVGLIARNRKIYPYYQNFVYEVVSKRFSTLGFAWQSLAFQIFRREMKL